MTEENAKTKWCPYTRFHVVPDQGIWVYSNRNNGELTSNCIASACMLWVETDNLPQPGNDFSEPVRSGHCGLAR